MKRFRTSACSLTLLIAASACDLGGSSRGGPSELDAGAKVPPASDAGARSGDLDASHCTLKALDAPPEQLSEENPGVPVAPLLSAEDAAELAAIQREYAATEDLGTDELLDRHELPLASGVSYDPAAAAGLPLIQDSYLALDADELATLGQHGFVISERKTFPTFVYGYETIYVEDLPLFVSADSILHAVHQSFDSLLVSIERESLIPALTRFLNRARARLRDGGAEAFGAEARADADLYLAVASSLLSGTLQPPVAGADECEILKFWDAIQAEEGWDVRRLFGVQRIFDFSQFTVRGHYTDDEELGRYFQALMWLGRIDFRLLETQADATQVLHRRQLEAALALRSLIDEPAWQDWQRIDRTVGMFMGEHDSMTLPQLDELLRDLGDLRPDELAKATDAEIAEALVAGRYGIQRISSHIMVNALPAGNTLPLSSIFLLFGQRYIADSHVFSNVVYDRVAHKPFRMMPDPLDVAFAALGNDQALGLLEPQLREYSYAPELSRMRALIESHPETYWQDNLYNRWISALRALSPTDEALDPAGSGLPEVAGTEAWGRRLLSTQLGAWAELRHDTLLYAKQSYTAAPTICEYPDVYVEPYPEFFAAMLAFAEHGARFVSEIGLEAESSPARYFTRLAEAMAILRDMAAHQRTGAPHSPEHIEFINRAIRTKSAGGGCGPYTTASDADGWYADLFLEPADKVAYDPNVADVHTQPADENGAPVGRVLHAGTGQPRLMVVTVETCSGPKAYAGLATSYFERITTDFHRLTDEEWAQELVTATPEDVPWMRDLVVR